MPKKSVILKIFKVKTKLLINTKNYKADIKLLKETDIYT